MTPLLRSQLDFFQYVCLWGRAIYTRGYEAKFLGALRDKRLYEIARWAFDNGYDDGLPIPKSSKNSLHFDSLALDVALFKDGKYIENVDGWRECGELWKQVSGGRGAWGGDFEGVNAGDANHISLPLGDGRK